MSMVPRIAIANAKYHKRKNILIGIAVFLTTLLLFLVLTIGYDMIVSEKAIINEIYPNWHAVFRNISKENAEKLSVHHWVTRWGLRGDLGEMAVPDANIVMLYLDAEGFDMYQQKLSEGRLPETENEIVVSRGILDRLHQSGQIGDTITVPYQVYRNGALDFIQEKEFVICGLLAERGDTAQQVKYYALVSKALLDNEIPSEEAMYHFVFRVYAEDAKTTEAIKARINQLAEQFKVSQQFITINEDYLAANYIDPVYVPSIILIMLIIVAAAMMTIYSIYYVSMGERVQEFGQIKAIGATQAQLRRLVLMEGMAVAAMAIPPGLLVGTALTRYVFLGIFELYKKADATLMLMKTLILNGGIRLYHSWIYLVAVAVALVTVYLSLLRPMKIAAKVSEIEAMRYQEGSSLSISKKGRKGFQNITVGRLARVYLAGNKRKSAMTICSMAVTGLFFMVVATILSCADPVDGANNAILGEYELCPIIEINNKEHPELDWSQVQKNNPLTEALREKIMQIDGIRAVECYKGTYVVSDVFYGDRVWVAGIPESGKEQVESGIVEGRITYEELKTGSKVIVDKKLLHWYPELAVGDILDVVVEDGNGTHTRQLEIAAVGDYPRGFTNYCFLIMAQEGIETFSTYNLNYHFHVFGQEKYDAEVESKLTAIVHESGRLQLRVWKDVYEEYQANMAVARGICYTFLGILGAICIMNMINTMIHSVHIRKKEIGMLQAVGMSDAQLHKMLRIEGLFYTMGTLIIAVCGGSIAGYPVFLMAKESGLLSISRYHYPALAAITVVLVLGVVQTVLTLSLGKSMGKKSVIDRIRFDN